MSSNVDIGTQCHISFQGRVAQQPRARSSPGEPAPTVVSTVVSTMEVHLSRTAIACMALVAGLVTPSNAMADRIFGNLQAGAQVTAADAAPFIGDWTLTLQGPNGPGTFDLSIKMEKEKVVGEITAATMATQQITDISKTDKSLVLSYSFTYEGNPVPTVVSLTPGPDGKVNAQIDFAGGAYIMSGTATHKEKAR
jgi:hypothetical protein